MTTRRFVLCVAALVAVRIAVVPITLSQRATNGRRTVLQGDIRRYHRIAIHPGVPHRDFTVEYPPITLGAIELLDGRTVRSATVRVMWSQMLVDLLIAAVVGWGWGRRACLAYLVLGLPFLAYPFLYLRLDLLSVALAILGLALVHRGRPGWGGATVALACFAKVWPVLLAPLFVIRRSWRDLGAFVTVGLAGTVAWVSWATIRGPIQVLTLRGARGWEIESTVGIVLEGVLGRRPFGERGAWRVGTQPGWAHVAIPVAIVLVTVTIWSAAARVRPARTVVLNGLAPLATLGAFLLLSPIISPQYLCWLLPFAAVAVTRGERAVGVMVAALMALSTLDLLLIKELVAQESLPLAVVLARNALLLAFTLYTLGRVLALAAAGADTGPAAARRLEAEVPPEGPGLEALLR